MVVTRSGTGIVAAVRGVIAMAVAVSAAEDAGVGQVGEDDPAVCQMVLGGVISEYHRAA